MKILDAIRISQKNLFKAKLRTTLTIAAVFIGALTLSLTNGVGNGIRKYVDEQMGNIAAENTMFVQRQQEFSLTGTDVNEYDPDKIIGGEFQMALLSSGDIDKLRETEGIVSVTPQYPLQIAYITTGEKKFEILPAQHVDGLTMVMKAGVTVDSKNAYQITIPDKYVGPLGFADAQGAIDKWVTIGFYNAFGQMVERDVKIVGVQEQTLLGGMNVSVSDALAEEVARAQSLGETGTRGYIGAIIKHNGDYNDDQVKELQTRLSDAGFSGITVEDQVGTVSQIIDTILIVLNVFGIITLLAAGFGIVNTLLMSVNERTSEIGLMKALGAKRRTIFSIFTLEAMSIGFWGAAIGILVSIVIGGIASEIASNTFLKEFIGFRLLAFPVLPSLLVLIGIMALAFCAGALPSLKASKLDPIKALRYE